MAQSFPVIQAHDGFDITESDTVDISADAGNTKGYRHCFVHNNHTAAGLVKITTLGGTELSIMINSGATSEIAATRVWSTGTDAALIGKLVAYVGKE